MYIKKLILFQVADEVIAEYIARDDPRSGDKVQCTCLIKVLIELFFDCGNLVVGYCFPCS